MRTKGIIYTVASAILFGITPLITTLIYQFGANSMTVVFFSFFICYSNASSYYENKPYFF